MNPTEHIHILLVEDDEIDVRAVERSFRKARIPNPLTVARDGFEAFDRLRGENGQPRLPRPRVILLDLNMPRMNGLEFLRELRSDPDLRDTAVFVLTTSNDERDRAAANSMNVAGYLLKGNADAAFLELPRLLETCVFGASPQFPPLSPSRPSPPPAHENTAH